MHFLLWTLLLNKLATRFLFLESHGHRPLNKQLDRELIRSSPRYGIGPGNWGKKRDHSKPDLEKQMLLKMFSLIMMDGPTSLYCILYPWVLELEFTAWVWEKGIGIMAWKYFLECLRSAKLLEQNVFVKMFQSSVTQSMPILNNTR